MNWKMCFGKGIKIAIIDSGVDTEREELANINITKLNSCKDKIGHGTAVTALLSYFAKESSFFCYNLFEQNGVVDADELIYALNYITEKEHYDIIHLSCGVMEDDLNELYIKCKEITDTGTIIVSAYDNEGAISYPAAFDNVIGVDWSKYCSDGTKYFYVENSAVNILGLGALQKLPWANGDYRYVAGASFAAPYISGIVAKMLESGIAPDNIIRCLKENAHKVLEINNEQYQPINQNVNIGKAVLLPFNKEIQTLSLFEDMLDFKVEGFYDFLPFRNVGKTCREITKFGYSERIVRSFNEIDWAGNFDTVILGHADIVSKALKKDILKEILTMCIYCFENHDVSLHMTDESERLIIRFFEMNINKYKSVKITWFGGEPLLEIDRVLRIMKAVNQLGKKYHVPVLASMITNGYLLDVNTFRKLLDNKVRFFEITIDGDKEQHDSLRFLANNSGTYDKIVNNLIEIQRNVPNNCYNIVIRTNVNKKSQARYVEFIENIKSLLNHDRRFQFQKGIISDWGGDSVKVLDQELLGKEEYTIDGVDSSKYSVLAKDLGQLRCYAGKYHGFVITHDARIQKCAKVGYNASDMDEKRINDIGFIRKNGSMYIDETKCAQFLELSEMEETCEMCTWLPICIASRCPITKVKKRKNDCKLKNSKAHDNIYYEMVSQILKGDYISIGTN